MKLSLTILALAAASASAAVPSLTPDNYDSITDGKTVFIKFFAPWCGHCKKMAPDWEKLSGEWESSDVGLIAEVDCTTEGKDLCDANGVKGFPSLKYGDPTALDDYQGGRTYADLAKFATENLKPICSPAKLELCDDDKKKEIEALMTTSDDDIKAKIAEEEKKLEAAEEEFKAEVEKLQTKYQSLMQEKDDKAAAVKSAGLGLMKSVLAFKAKADKYTPNLAKTLDADSPLKSGFSTSKNTYMKHELNRTQQKNMSGAPPNFPTMAIERSHANSSELNQSTEQSKAHVPKLLLTQALQFQNSQNQKNADKQRNGPGHANSLQVQTNATMFISQENPLVKGNNFDSNRARAEARIGTSVEETPANFSIMEPSPEKQSNPLHLEESEMQTRDEKTTTAEAATVE